MSVLNDIPNNDCKVVLHCWSLSPGSAVGKKTAAGIPGPAESRRNPTAVSRACQPGTPPTLFSTLCWEVYMELRWPFCILWRDFSTCNERSISTLLSCRVRRFSHFVTTRVSPGEVKLAKRRALVPDTVEYQPKPGRWGRMGCWAWHHFQLTCILKYKNNDHNYKLVVILVFNNVTVSKNMITARFDIYAKLVTQYYDVSI